MIIQTDCPNCGYNSYKVLNTKTGKEVIMTISKCDDGGCDLNIIDEDYYEHYESSNDLLLFSDKSYKVLGIIETDCV